MDYKILNKYNYKSGIPAFLSVGRCPMGRNMNEQRATPPEREMQTEYNRARTEPCTSPALITLTTNKKCKCFLKHYGKSTNANPLIS